MRILEKLKELQVHIASLDVKEADTDPDVFWDYMNSRREYKDLLVNNASALLEVVEALEVSFEVIRQLSDNAFVGVSIGGDPKYSFPNDWDTRVKVMSRISTALAKLEVE